jgi:hypothetical protein
MLAIVAGYPDGNDCDVLRGDPVFKMALDRPPVSGPALCSQPTVSRIENMPRRPELYRMAKAMLDLYCDSFPIVPSHLTLDLDESFDRVHGEQELRKFNAYYDDWGFLPILEFALLTRPMGVAVPFEGYNRHPSRDGNACFCGALAVDQAALAIGGGPATGMRRDFRPFRANSPSTRQFQKRRIRPSLIMPGVG